MAGGRHLEKLKNRHISAAVQPILMQFGTMMHFEPLDRPDRQKFKILHFLRTGTVKKDELRHGDKLL